TWYIARTRFALRNGVERCTRYVSDSVRRGHAGARTVTVSAMYQVRGSQSSSRRLHRAKPHSETRYERLGAAIPLSRTACDAPCAARRVRLPRIARAGIGIV